MSHAELAELEKLTLADKLRVMEVLWESLSREGQGEAIVPGWHDDVLAERTRRLDTGEEVSSSWAEAKRRIREQTRDD